MDTKPKSGHPKILGTAKLLASKLITKYGKRESEGISKILVEAITGKPYLSLLIDSEALFDDVQLQNWQRAEGQLLANIPIQYVIGKAWFRDLQIKIGPGALIPRPETEALIDLVIEKIKKNNSAQLLDIGTGSGCIALAIAQEIPDAKVFAVDVSEDALAIAKANSKLNHLEVDFTLLDVLSAGKDAFSDLDGIVCNPPYIPQSEAGEMAEHVLAHEPSLALFVPDDDPLLFYNKVSILGKFWLKSGGWLFFEIHEAYGKEVVSLLIDLGYVEVELRQDLTGRDRMVAGQHI